MKIKREMSGKTIREPENEDIFILCLQGDMVIKNASTPSEGNPFPEAVGTCLPMWKRRAKLANPTRMVVVDSLTGSSIPFCGSLQY